MAMEHGKDENETSHIKVIKKPKGTSLQRK